MARAGKKWDNGCCSVHDGTIGSFERLGHRIRTIADWEQVVKREGVNFLRVGKIACGIVTVGLVATGAGAVAAPAIGGALGGLGGLSGLTGAAATSHGLAVIGGGSLTAGGLGMAGEATVIAVGTGLLGGAGGGILVNKFVGEIKGFAIRTPRKGVSTQVIVVNGFLSQGENLITEWKPALKKHFGKATWFEIDWESKRLQELGKVAFGGAGKSALSQAVKKFAKHATKQAGKNLSPVAWLSTALDVGGNPWSIAMAKARQTGQLLADLILRADGRRRYTLLGHSLGARVIYYTLQSLAEAQRGQPRVREVHLLGGAVGADADIWENLPKAVNGRIYNYYSKRDSVLQTLYRAGTLFLSEPIGRTAIRLQSDKVRNIDVTDFVGGHSKFKRHLADYMFVA